ncbi:exopolysaccharide production repressor exox [Ciceribacter ferrooxidans]|uniref:Exopolysaccharide production repressor exox n=2 Tax=Ciceribacter ferrooxidans TaxID=2509717 RepID=A0A4Q2SW04_9HYPH|nr:exopolysaccharide production repressor exox [Ciceribacter ferrooxidans]
MYGPRVMMSMVGVLIVFGLVTYALTGSLTTTLIQTAVSAILLQVGYFLAVLYMVAKAARQRKSELETSATDEKAKSARVSRLNSPGPSKL